MTWINREAEQRLLRAMVRIPRELEDGTWTESVMIPARALADLNVIDAEDDEAEAALERLFISAMAFAAGSMAVPDIDACHNTLRTSLRAARAIHTPEETGTASFEVREEDGVRFWYGAEDGWKDATEVGEDGVIRADAKHFAVGTVLTMCEPLPPRPEPAAKPKETQEETP